MVSIVCRTDASWVRVKQASGHGNVHVVQQTTAVCNAVGRGRCVSSCPLAAMYFLFERVACVLEVGYARLLLSCRASPWVFFVVVGNEMTRECS